MINNIEKRKIKNANNYNYFPATPKHYLPSHVLNYFSAIVHNFEVIELSDDPVYQNQH